MPPNDIAPGVLQALNYLGRRVREEHVLFRDIPMEPRMMGRGSVSVDIVLPAHFDEGGVAHSGAFTIVLDTVLAFASWTMMEQFEVQATINLKTDFYRSIPTGEKITCEATCKDIVDDIAYCQGMVSTRNGIVLAHAAGTFMVGTTSSNAKASRL
jgi:acyl-coenzyme A thioesterase PaaI-like protein